MTRGRLRVAAVTSLVGSLAYAVLAADVYPGGQLIPWIALSAAVSVVNFLFAGRIARPVLELPPLHRDPQLLVGLFGLAWALLPWLDPTLLVDLAHSGRILIFLLGISAVVGSTPASTPRASWAILAPVWLSTTLVMLWMSRPLPALLTGLFGLAMCLRTWRTAVELRGFVRHARDRDHQAMAELSWAATHDALTDLYDRTGLSYAFDELIARYPMPDIAAVFLDLDEFKPVNDTYGHPAGDRLLVTIARRLEGMCRDRDVVARLGGDEFVIVVPGPTEEQSLLRLGRRLIDGISEPIELEGGTVSVTASVGVATMELDNVSLEALLAYADHAQYEAKHSGRNQVRLIDPEELTRSVRERISRQFRADAKLRTPGIINRRDEQP